MIKGGVKTSFGGVCSQNARRHVLNRKSNREAARPRDWTYCSHKPECIVATNPPRTGLNHDHNMTFFISIHRSYGSTKMLKYGTNRNQWIAPENKLCKSCDVNFPADNLNFVFHGPSMEIVRSRAFTLFAESDHEITQFRDLIKW